MRIGLTGIVVDDQDQAERFYTEVLGLQVKTGAPYAPTSAGSAWSPRSSPTGWSWCCTWSTSANSNRIWSTLPTSALTAAARPPRSWIAATSAWAAPWLRARS